MVEQEEQEFLRTMVLARGSMLDRTNSEEVEKYKELIGNYVNTYFPGRVKEKDRVKKELEDVFETLFRGPDGKPKAFKMKGNNSRNNKK